MSYEFVTNVIEKFFIKSEELYTEKVYLIAISKDGEAELVNDNSAVANLKNPFKDKKTAFAIRLYTYHFRISSSESCFSEYASKELLDALNKIAEEILFKAYSWDCWGYIVVGQIFKTKTYEDKKNGGYIFKLEKHVANFEAKLCRYVSPKLKERHTLEAMLLKLKDIEERIIRRYDFDGMANIIVTFLSRLQVTSVIADTPIPVPASQLDIAPEPSKIEIPEKDIRLKTALEKL